MRQLGKLAKLGSNLMDGDAELFALRDGGVGGPKIVGVAV
jgi:hypothetical protein